CMFGTGFIRLGYGAQFTPTPDDLDTSAPDTGGRKTMKRVEYDDLIHPNMPWTLAAHPGSMILPTGCSSIHDARWVCHEFSRPVDDVKADPRLDEKVRNDIEQATGQTRLIAQARQGQRQLTGVVMWEIRDKKTGEVFVISPHVDHLRVESKTLIQ